MATTQPDEPLVTERLTATHFSAASAREQAARLYVLVVTPALLVLSLALMALTYTHTRDSIPTTSWVTVVLLMLVHLGGALAVLRGATASLVAGSSTIIDCSILIIGLSWSPQPLGASASATFFVVAAAYFLRPAASIGFTLATVLALAVQSHRLENWDEPYVFTVTAFVALITGIVVTFIMSQVRRTEAALEQVAAEQEEALERLEQVVRSRDRLIANVSHELRTPLTATIGAIETLLRDDVPIDETERTWLMRMARDGGLRLLALVEDLLTAGATRPDSLELDAAPERLASVVEDAIVGIDPGEGRTITIEVLEDPLVLIDRLRMLQVVANLVVNAVRHGRGRILIQTARDTDGNAVLRVLDEGDGVDPQHVHELFLPFARFSTRTDSTGLGLAICRTIIEAHGGTIAYSRIDDRTCFEVHVPRADGPVARR